MRLLGSRLRLDHESEVTLVSGTRTRTTVILTPNLGHSDQTLVTVNSDIFRSIIGRTNRLITVRRRHRILTGVGLNFLVLLIRSKVRLIDRLDRRRPRVGVTTHRRSVIRIGTHSVRRLFSRHVRPIHLIRHRTHGIHALLGQRLEDLLRRQGVTRRANGQNT